MFYFVKRDFLPDWTNTTTLLSKVAKKNEKRERESY